MLRKEQNDLVTRPGPRTQWVACSDAVGPRSARRRTFRERLLAGADGSAFGANDELSRGL